VNHFLYFFQIVKELLFLPAKADIQPPDGGATTLTVAHMVGYKLSLLFHRKVPGGG
jgi:hypothetical protein